MKRTTRWGLAVMAALALTALISSAASAATFNASKYPAKVSAKPTGGTHEFSFFGGELKFSCTGPTLEDKMELREPGSRRSRSGSGSDVGCLLGSFTLNNCDLIFRPGNESEGVFKGTVDVGPAGCGPVTFDYSNCHYEIPVQTGLSATYDNVESEGVERVSASLAATGMKYTTSGAGCPKKGTFTDGGWDGDWLLSGKAVEGGGAVGLYLESASGSPSLYLEAESYAAKLSGEQLAGDPLIWSFPFSESAVATISCKATTFSGEFSSPKATVGLTPAHSECTNAQGSNTTVKLNTCTYKAALNAGTLQVSCSKEGDMIEMTTYVAETPICIAKVGAQTISGLASETRAAGTSRYVESDWNLTGIKYTLVKNSFFCPYINGTYTNGTYTGGSRLDGKTGGGSAQRIEIRS